MICLLGQKNYTITELPIIYAKKGSSLQTAFGFFYRKRWLF